MRNRHKNNRQEMEKNKEKTNCREENGKWKQVNTEK